MRDDSYGNTPLIDPLPVPSLTWRHKTKEHFMNETTSQVLWKRLRLCIFVDLGPRGSICKLRKIKTNGTNVGRQRDRQESR